MIAHDNTDPILNRTAPYTLKNKKTIKLLQTKTIGLLYLILYWTIEYSGADWPRGLAGNCRLNWSFVASVRYVFYWDLTLMILRQSTSSVNIKYNIMTKIKEMARRRWPVVKKNTPIINSILIHAFSLSSAIGIGWLLEKSIVLIYFYYLFTN